MKRYSWRFVLMLSVLFLGTVCATAQKQSKKQSKKHTVAKAQRGREVFDKAYNQFFGPEGSRITYSVNIIGLFKTSGTIWNKGKKSAWDEPKVRVWNNGEKYVRLDKSKKQIDIFFPNDPDRNSHSSLMEFNPENYNYELEEKDGEYHVLIKAKPKVSGIKNVTLALERQSLAPKYLKVKWGIFHIKIHLSNFKAGGISDEVFEFPAEKYKGYNIEDYRKK